MPDEILIEIQIYGVEPNTDHHESLRRRIKQEGLSDVYEIAPVGVEDLGSKWAQKGEVDSIVTVGTAIPAKFPPDENISSLFRVPLTSTCRIRRLLPGRSNVSVLWMVREK